MTDQEDPERLYALGMSYMLGVGRPKDPGAGAGCLRQAADRGSLAAKRDLGIAYLNGLGVKRCRNQRPSSSWPDPQCEKFRLLMADERFAALIGNIVLENPELQNIIENDGEPAGFSAIFETVSDSS
ncbi:hypothetical protein PAA26_07185 [Methanomassiliicoccaceae archaeon COG_1]|nr:hypothetical protein [Methanomassiliicoccaceae archaeon COG_1]